MSQQYSALEKDLKPKSPQNDKVLDVLVPPAQGTAHTTSKNVMLYL